MSWLSTIFIWLRMFVACHYNVNPVKSRQFVSMALIFLVTIGNLISCFKFFALLHFYYYIIIGKCTLWLVWSRRFHILWPCLIVLLQNYLCIGWLFPIAHNCNGFVAEIGTTVSIKPVEYISHSFEIILISNPLEEE